MAEEAAMAMPVLDSARGALKKAKQVKAKRGKAASKWLSGSWPLQQFDGELPLNKRKAEWIRFRNQFERIVACKEPVEPVVQLTGLKIFAGSYLLSVIEAQENLLVGADNIYSATITALNRYFDQTCDYTKERMKFREMRMVASEPFVDWVLRLENQAKFCEFDPEQRYEEFSQALIRRSVPEIATKLYEMSDVFHNDLERIMAHGRHLDYIRLETEEVKLNAKVETSTNAEGVNEANLMKPVNAVFNQMSGSSSMRYGSRRESHSKGNGAVRFRNVGMRNGSGHYSANNRNCSKCGRIHGFKECRAHRVKCYACGKEGHFAEFCFSRTKDDLQNKRGRVEGGEMYKSEVGRINQVR
ncbi:uncharacterized protein LOC110676044 [Aedes aegypti]|uniref:Uncharacterized protein n=1 Tax=Aedes aegypti TaxID=7159 RepID=A0A6I8U0S7_AEDAE|nr:uncharacterized protein LOC110676044 [Aedes aegypti]